LTQTVALVSGLAELLLSFMLGILVAYTSFRIFNRITRNLNEIGALKQNNIAAGILLGSVLISSALIIRQAVYPTISALQTKLFAGINLLAGIALFAQAILYAGIATVISITAIALGLRLFLRLTREIDELAEISRNNIAVAITVGSVIIVMGLFLSQGVQSLLSAIVPDPAFGRIQVMGGPQ
jgi:uncharacterized membrane protein YjfL (UPF0719 family)